MPTLATGDGHARMKMRRMRMRMGQPRGKGGCSVTLTHRTLLPSLKCRRAILFSFPTSGCCKSS